MSAQTWSERGLSDDEARARLARDGPNRLPQGERRSLARISFEVARLAPVAAAALAATWVQRPMLSAP